ncbi:hypothetical protein [Brachybacterium epidermidis]|uniref:hypothetical protein n=1 Tax=Brachybacterium epidermidis TaxID=2781983 RepID=UPI00398F2DD2
MSQPPQNGWGQQSGDPYGQPQGNGQDGYGQPSPNAGYGQEGYGQASPNAGYSDYGQGSPNSGYGPGFGEGSQAMEPQQGEKKPGSKLPLLICAGCAVLALIVGIIGGGIFLFTRDGGEQPPTDGGGTTSQEETTDPAEETTDPAEGTTEPGEETTDPAEETTDPGEETTDPPADGDKGTREAPFASGETFTLPDGEGGEVDVSFGAVNWDATAEIKEENQFNEDPGEGEVHIMVPVTVTYRGSDSVSPSFLLNINYVAESGNSYRSAALVVPNGTLDQGDLYDGGSAEFNVPFTIPTDAVQKGAFNVSVLLDFSGDEVWVAAE